MKINKISAKENKRGQMKIVNKISANGKNWKNKKKEWRKKFRPRQLKFLLAISRKYRTFSIVREQKARKLSSIYLKEKRKSVDNK